MADAKTDALAQGLAQGAAIAHAAAKLRGTRMLLTAIRQRKLIAGSPAISTLPTPKMLHRHAILMRIENENFTAPSVFPQRSLQRISGYNLAQRYRVPVCRRHFTGQWLLALITDLNNKFIQAESSPLNRNRLSHKG